MTNSEAVVDHTEANKLFGTTQKQDEKTDVTEEVAATQENETQETPIYLGGKKFSSVDELARYTQTLEAERAADAQRVEQTQPVAGKKVSDLLFEDPEKALQLHEQQIIERMKAEDRAKSEERQWWDSFYSKNKDLSEDRDVVMFTMNANWENLRTLHPDQAGERLAEYARKTILRFRKTEGKREELPSGQARAASGTSLSAPKIQETKAAPVDFVTQLKKIQSKRK